MTTQKNGCSDAMGVCAKFTNRIQLTSSQIYSRSHAPNVALYS